jgi:hypothetical protein
MAHPLQEVILSSEGFLIPRRKEARLNRTLQTTTIRNVNMDQE